VRRNSGVYQYGDGDKSIIWYWEFDVEKRYFHQFRTIDYAAAVEFYKAKIFTMWGETRLRRRHREDCEGEGVVWGDFHDHTTEYEHDEQREAETDLQGQNDG